MQSKLVKILAPLVFLCTGPAAAQQFPEPVPVDRTEVISSEAASFRIEQLAAATEIPWSMEFLPDGNALLGDRKTGKLQHLDLNSGVLTPITGLPGMLLDGSIGAGLFDVRVDADFSSNGRVYIAYAVGSREANGLALARYTLQGFTLMDGEELLQTRPRIEGKYHFGGRLAQLDGYLFLTTGEGYNRPELAQDLSAHPGKVLRIHDDGRAPADNPFTGKDKALPEIWSYGIRSPQGLAVHPQSREIWINEHGPQGGDEINIARRGLNFGWPVITYGEEYGGGAIGEGLTRMQGMQQPVYYWRPSIAPSGMSFYSGAAFPGWQHSLFIGGLAVTHLNRTVIENDRVIHEERLLENRDWRIRFVEQGPDGYLYLGVDRLGILRLVPAE